MCDAPLTLKLITRTEQIITLPPLATRRESYPLEKPRGTSPSGLPEKRAPVGTLFVEKCGRERRGLEDSGVDQRGRRPRDERCRAGGGAGGVLARLGGRGGRGGGIW